MQGLASSKMDDFMGAGGNTPPQAGGMGAGGHTPLQAGGMGMPPLSPQVHTDSPAGPFRAFA